MVGTVRAVRAYKAKEEIVDYRAAIEALKYSITKNEQNLADRNHELSNLEERANKVGVVIESIKLSIRECQEAIKLIENARDMVIKVNTTEE